MPKTKKDKVYCPDCKREIKGDLASHVVGDILECEDCGCEVELLSLSPLRYVELLEEK